MKEPKDHIQDQELNDPEFYNEDFDQEEWDDHQQSKEDLAMEERD